MKFMKIGTKPDAFQADGNYIRYVSSDLASDVIVNVGKVKFCLHKFPLLSKSILMQNLVHKASEENSEEVTLADIPGGATAFEICAKFCYGMTFILNAYNVAAVRCAAEYLQMTEEVDQGNLVFKIEVFLTSSIFRSWKDSIIVLQASQSLLPWSENLKIIGKCVDSLASKTSVDPSNVHWSYTHNRKLATCDNIVEVGLRSHGVEPVPDDWWVEDVSELDIDLYKRLIIAIKSKGRIGVNVIAEALKTYAIRWLPDTIEDMISEDRICRNKDLLNAILNLLPSDNGAGCTCTFLLKLLHIAILVGADEDTRNDLINKVSMKLDEASVNDLLIRSTSLGPKSPMYDVELIQNILSHFTEMRQVHEGVDLDSLHGKEISCKSVFRVAKLIDGYLAKVAHDLYLSPNKFIDLARMIQESARLTHDGLYMAIDNYLKEHPDLTKSDRKKLCELLDVKKLSADASIHAAQNEKLPLRIVVQVLFFEQVRAVQSIKTAQSDDTSRSITNTTDDEAERTSSLRHQMNKMIINEDQLQLSAKLLRKNSKSRNGAQLLPSRSRRIFSKIWNVGKKKNSFTSGSSPSPSSLVVGETRSSGSSSRRRRNSIS